MKDQLDPAPLSASAILDHLTSFGEVDNLYIYKSHAGVSKGYGFCDFKQTSPPTHLYYLKSSLMPDGVRLYFHQNKDQVKRRTLIAQKKARKTKYRRNKK